MYTKHHYNTVATLSNSSCFCFGNFSSLHCVFVLFYFFSCWSSVLSRHHPAVVVRIEKEKLFAYFLHRWFILTFLPLLPILCFSVCIPNTEKMIVSNTNDFSWWNFQRPNKTNSKMKTERERASKSDSKKRNLHTNNQKQYQKKKKKSFDDWYCCYCILSEVVTVFVELYCVLVGFSSLMSVGLEQCSQIHTFSDHHSKNVHYNTYTSSHKIIK